MVRAPSILAVDRNRCNLGLLNQFLEKEGYVLSPVSDLEEFDSILTRKAPLGIALIDIAGFDPRIWERCEELNQSHVPWVLVAPQCRFAAFQQEGLRHGARSVLAKPLNFNTLLDLIRGVLEAPR